MFREHVRLCESLAPTDYHDGLIEYAKSTHPKRKLRERALAEVVNVNLWNHDSWLTKPIKGKLKRFEWAKPGKIPRLICDLGVVASLVMGFAAKRIKGHLESFNRDFANKVEFIPKPTHSVLNKVFSQLINPVGKSYFAAHSDDSCFAAHCLDGVFRCNMDISSCDATHTGYMFESFMNAIPDELALKTYLRKGLNQLKGKFHISTVDGKKKLRLVVNPRYDDEEGLEQNPFWLFLASGSTWTTAINTWANFLIHESLAMVNWGEVRKEDAAAMVVNQARHAGYKVTCEVADIVQKLQFLKHSPTSNGEAFLNLGVILRAHGICHGDLPGSRKESFETRANRFAAGVATGFKHAGKSSFTTVMTEKYNFGEAIFTSVFTKDAHDNYDSVGEVIVSDDDIMLRYGISHSQLMHLCNLYKNAGVGDIIRCEASDRILNLDYGLGQPIIHSTYLNCELRGEWWRSGSSHQLRPTGDG